MATILVFYGRNEGEWYTLSPSKATVFGRSDELLAEILDPMVSRRHLEIRYEDVGERFYAIDLESRNGLFVNGERVDAFQSLHEGDVIRIGDTLLLFTSQVFDNDEDVAARIAQAQHDHASMVQLVARKAQQHTQPQDLSLTM